MNDTAKTILWVGIFLITMIIVAHWSSFKQMLFTPGNSSSGGGFPHITIPPGSPFPFPITLATPRNKRVG